MQFIIIILHLHRFYEPLIHLKSWPKDMHWMGIGHQFNSLVSTLSPYESYLSSFITISWSKSLQLLISIGPVYCLMARADGATVPCIRGWCYVGCGGTRVLCSPICCLSLLWLINSCCPPRTWYSHQPQCCSLIHTAGGRRGGSALRHICFLK